MLLHLVPVVHTAFLADVSQQDFLTIVHFLCVLKLLSSRFMVTADNSSSGLVLTNTLSFR